MNKVKITVLKTEFFADLAKEYGRPELGPCAAMKEGQVFYADVKCPAGFCPVIFKLEATGIPSVKGE